MKRPENRPWLVLESTCLSDRPWFTVRRERVQLPSGVEIPEWYILDYPDWVNIIAVTEDDQYVFITQYRHAVGETRFELVAGCCEEGETPLESARRELMEETGYGGGEWSLFMTTSPNPTSHSNRCYTYLAKGVRRLGEQNPEPTEEIEVQLLAEAEVRELLSGDEIIQCLHAAPLWKYFATR